MHHGQNETSSCGVGFVASLEQKATYATLESGRRALVSLEHRGGVGGDLRTGDGTGVMTDIPHELLGARPGDAVAHLFLPRDPTVRLRSLQIFEETFRHAGVPVLRYRDVPVGPVGADRARPEFLMAFIARPEQCSNRASFEKILYTAKQLTRSRLRAAGILKQFFFTSLSAGTIVYKGLCRSDELAGLFPDLADPRFVTRFVLFHRRFSTNTATAWDTAQPFRVVAHNGEINTVSGNRAWSYARERALGLAEDELLTHRGISDSGSVNEVIEALLFRSSIPHPEDILAILMPRANDPASYYRFWKRAMEPWDGPALFTYCDGRSVGARLDRNGFRPCRWARTATHFYLSSEAGSFSLAEGDILAKGSLSGGGAVSVSLRTGDLHFKDAPEVRENRHATFDPRLVLLPRLAADGPHRAPTPEQLGLFGFTEEDLGRLIPPLVNEGKEAIGSMGDSARLAVLSDERRSIFDFFYQRFAQVTNPPFDYLREGFASDMTVVLGRKPNIFEPKELVPVKLGIELEGPVISLSQMMRLKALDHDEGFEGEWPGTVLFDTTFPREAGTQGLLDRLEAIRREAVHAIQLHKRSVLLLSDRRASGERPPIPPIFVVAALTHELNRLGLRLRISMVVESGEVKEAHDVAVLTAFGAAGVCPYLLLGLAGEHEPRLVRALESGLLKIMSKMGISVFRSYQTAELHTILGFAKEVHDRFFPGRPCAVGGLTLDQIVERRIREFAEARTPRHAHLYREHPKETEGERHAITIQRAKRLHRGEWDEFVRTGTEANPISFRHLLRPREAERPLSLDAVQSRDSVCHGFGSGAMSFGAISAEAQRDLILAMRELGGRSNSGEGGENPYYFTDGITAHTKQVASGRFGVTAEYLVTGDEIQIKIAQGAKPGEGGQLMAPKVSADIARARFSDTHIDLISPPPMHDIYSIEDLKQLIYELRQVKPEARVSVKLVAGEGVGTIAVGVAKAGADIIQISGHDGGTGAAPLGSMKHAGLPWELGLWEAHRELTAQGMRHRVTLRTDGGLLTGRDIVTAACLGAEEFDFGKLVLIAEGCIMARVCEKNTCPTGIATHDPKFKRLYRGTKDKVVAALRHVADDARAVLARMGVHSLRELCGRTDLLELDPVHEGLVVARGLDLSGLLGPSVPLAEKTRNPFVEEVSEINARIVSEARAAGGTDRSSQQSARPIPPSTRDLAFAIRPSDRAVVATLNGVRAANKVTEPLSLVFRGSAGQGFGVFLTAGIDVRLYGEANDSVGKSMSGGRMVISPSPEGRFPAEASAIIGNCALYGATGGTLFVRGLAGNRFAVRNSGATAVVEGVGMHAGEYMTRGTVVILGECGPNVGAGMTGGELYLDRRNVGRLNGAYVRAVESGAEDRARLAALLAEYAKTTGAPVRKHDLVRCVPLAQAVAAAEKAVERPLVARAPASPELGTHP